MKMKQAVYGGVNIRGRASCQVKQVVQVNDQTGWLAGNAAYGNFTSPITIPWLAAGRVILIHGQYRDRAAIAIAPMN